MESIDVFTHGRNDGETFGAVFTEAFYHKKPVISHKAASNGHIEVIGDAGIVFSRGDISGYSTEMKKLKEDKNYYDEKSKIGYDRYLNYYSIDTQMKRFSDLIKSAKDKGRY